ncbi:cobyrinate a,c-diamide synthase [Geothrix limicola]|nr:cobyrinate a,c-diamide synthase [Geothrix limicola]
MPGLVLAAPNSGSGKTTLTAGLLTAFRRRGHVVAPFKAGPDYLDPLLHGAAAGRPSWNLDGWFMDDAGLRDAWVRGGAGANLGLVEGVMGLFDGADPVSFQGSTADLARRLGLPVVLVVDAQNVAGSVAATVLGHATLWPDLQLKGVLFNRVGSEGHYRLLAEAVHAHTDVRPLGFVPPDARWHLPERHLGLHRPHDLPDLEDRLGALADQLEATVDLVAMAKLATRPAPGSPAPITSQTGGDLPVALAQDEAFSFVYADTLDRLSALGVRWVPFSPLRDPLPEGVAGVYLPGGYPELHAEALSLNRAFLDALRERIHTGLPCYAECGGYMILADSLEDAEGRAHPMAGLIPGRVRMTSRLQQFGYKQLRLERDCLLGPAGSEGRGHEFHHSTWEGSLESPAYEATPLRGEGRLEGHAAGNCMASYVHLHFAANPAWAEHWMARMRVWRG